MKHAEQIFRYVQYNVLWHTSHFKDTGANTVEDFVIAAVKFHESPRLHNTVDTKYYVQSASFVNIHCENT
jgi:hypothetical protein